MKLEKIGISTIKKVSSMSDFEVGVAYGEAVSLIDHCQNILELSSTEIKLESQTVVLYSESVIGSIKNISKKAWDFIIKIYDKTKRYVSNKITSTANKFNDIRDGSKRLKTLISKLESTSSVLEVPKIKLEQTVKFLESALTPELYLIGPKGKKGLGESILGLGKLNQNIIRLLDIEKPRYGETVSTALSTKVKWEHGIDLLKITKELSKDIESYSNEAREYKDSKEGFVSDVYKSTLSGIDKKLLIRYNKGNSTLESLKDALMLNEAGKYQTGDEFRKWLLKDFIKEEKSVSFDKIERIMAASNEYNKGKANLEAEEIIKNTRELINNITEDFSKNIKNKNNKEDIKGILNELAKISTNFSLINAVYSKTLISGINIAHDISISLSKSLENIYKTLGEEVEKNRKKKKK